MINTWNNLSSQSAVIVYTELVDVYIGNTVVIFLVDIATFEVFWVHTLAWIYLHNLGSSSSQDIIHNNSFLPYQL